MSELTYGNPRGRGADRSGSGYCTWQRYSVLINASKGDCGVKDITSWVVEGKEKLRMIDDLTFTRGARLYGRHGDEGAESDSRYLK